jgi:hypothetical protein
MEWGYDGGGRKGGQTGEGGGLLDNNIEKQKYVNTLMT